MELDEKEEKMNFWDSFSPATQVFLSNYGIGKRDVNFNIPEWVSLTLDNRVPGYNLYLRIFRFIPSSGLYFLGSIGRESLEGPSVTFLFKGSADEVDTNTDDYLPDVLITDVGVGQYVKRHLSRVRAPVAEMGDRISGIYPRYLPGYARLAIHPSPTHSGAKLPDEICISHSLDKWDYKVVIFYQEDGKTYARFEEKEYELEDKEGFVSFEEIDYRLPCHSLSGRLYHFALVKSFTDGVMNLRIGQTSDDLLVQSLILPVPNGYGMSLDGRLVSKSDAYSISGAL